MEVESQLPYFVLKFTCPRGSLKIALLKFKLLSHIPQSGKVLACWAACMRLRQERGVFMEKEERTAPLSSSQSITRLIISYAIIILQS